MIIRKTIIRTTTDSSNGRVIRVWWGGSRWFPPFFIFPATSSSGKQLPQEERAFPFLQHGYLQEAKNDFLPSSDA
jgi:hypothetical protein